jgi:hypothetical protein
MRDVAMHAVGISAARAIYLRAIGVIDTRLRGHPGARSSVELFDPRALANRRLRSGSAS